MDQLKWQQQYECGNELIDVQHRRLFEKINDCIEASRKGSPREELLGRLQDIQDCLLEHFGNEESLMDDASREMLAHKKQHAYIRNHLKDEVAKYRERADDRDSAQGILYYLHEWYLNHLGSADECWGSNKSAIS